MYNLGGLILDYKKICTNEAIALIVVVMINQVLLGSAKDIVMDTASSSWLHTIFISIIAIALVFIISKLFSKFINLSIIDISEYLAGSILKIIVCLGLIGFFILSAALIINHMCSCLSIIYLSNINILFIIMLFLVAAVIVAKKDISVIAKNNLIVLYLLLIPGIILVVTTFFNSQISNLFPILGYGFRETFFSNATNLYAFSGLIYLFLISPILNDTGKYKKIGLVSVIISSLYLFFTVISLLITFPFSCITEDLLSIYLLSRAISFGTFLERVDSIYLFLWILSSFSYLSIIFYFLTDTFQKMTNTKNRSATIYGFASIILGLTLLIKDISDLRFGQRIVFPVYTIVLFLMLFIILIIAYFKNKKKPIPLE